MKGEEECKEFVKAQRIINLAQTFVFWKCTSKSISSSKSILKSFDLFFLCSDCGAVPPAEMKSDVSTARLSGPFIYPSCCSSLAKDKNWAQRKLWCCSDVIQFSSLSHFQTKVFPRKVSGLCIFEGRLENLPMSLNYSRSYFSYL